MSFGYHQQISTGFASWLRYCSDVAQRRSTKLCTMFGRLLAGTLYTFLGLLPLSEFCQLQNSLCVQVFRSPTLAALLYGIRAVGVSQRLRRNGITELSQRAPSILGRATITLGIGPHSSFYIVFLCNWPFYVHLLCNDIYNFQRSFFSRYHVYQQKQTQKRNHITENAITSTQPTFILLTFRSLSETFIRRSLLNSSSGSCHDSDATLLTLYVYSVLHTTTPLT